MLELVYTTRQRQPGQPAPWTEASDRDLLMGIRSDEEAAFNELIRRKARNLRHLAENILGEAEEARDIVQVAFFKVWENRKRFDDRWSPNTWIYRITTNLAIDYLRTRNSRERQAGPVRSHVFHLAEEIVERNFARVDQGEIMTVFQELSAGLPEKQRLAFVLHEIQELKVSEVAEILGCRESSVRNHLFSARRYLRQEMIRRYPEYASGFTELDAKEEA
jgi:RNA polymerase sigma-70 factor (ECF subfamily)